MSDNAYTIDGGFTYFNLQPLHQKERAVIIVGLPQSGQGILTRIFAMGEGFTTKDTYTKITPSYTVSIIDTQLADQEKKANLAEAIIKSLSKNNGLPSNQINQAFGSITPAVIFILKDLNSAATLTFVGAKAQYLNQVEQALIKNKNLVKGIKTSPFPTMVISFEKLVNRRNVLLNELFKFVKVKNKGEVENQIAILEGFFLQSLPKNPKIRKNISLQKGDDFYEVALKGEEQQQTLPVVLSLNDGKPFAKGQTQIPVKSFREGINKIAVFLSHNPHTPAKNFLFSYNKTKAKPFVFLHIPKTAGTSFRTSFAEQFSNDEVFPTSTEILLNRGQYPTLQALEEKPVQMLENLQFITGHFQKFQYRGLPFSPRFITFFRNPKARIVSNLRHFATYDKRLKGKTLEEVFEVRGAEMENMQLRFICNSKSGYEKLIQLPKSPFQNEVKKLLSQLAFFGLTEAIQDSIKMLNHTFGFSFDPLPKRNESVQRDTVSKGLLMKIEQMTKHENWLYEVAEELFRKKSEKLTT